MFRSPIVLAMIAVPSLLAAQTTSTPTVAAGAAAAAHYTTSDTEIGTLLDDPAAKAVLDKNFPGLSSGEQIDMARGMTLKTIQQYAPDMITDARLAATDAEFAKLPTKK